MNEVSPKISATRAKPWLYLLWYLYRETSPTSGVVGLGFSAILAAILAGINSSANLPWQKFLGYGFVLLVIGILRILFGEKIKSEAAVKLGLYPKQAEKRESLPAKAIFGFLALLALYLAWITVESSMGR